MKEERILYLTGKHPNINDSSVNAVGYKSLPNSHDRMVKFGALKKRDEEILRNDWLGGAQLSTRFE